MIGFIKSTTLAYLVLDVTILLCVTTESALLPQAAPQSQSAVSAPQQWEETFDALDATKWENFVIEGEAARALAKDGRLKLIVANNSRAGIRSKQSFDGDRFIVEATLSKDSTPGSGKATLAVLFDETGKDRIEWTLSAVGKIEAYDYTKGESERVASREVGEFAGKLGIGRRGDDFYFTLNDDVILHRLIAGVPVKFRVLLYGTGPANLAWDATRIMAQKAPPAVTASVPSSRSGETDVANTTAVWNDDFNGDMLDSSKWDEYTFEGGGGLKMEVKGGHLKQRGSGASRSGVRSKQTFTSNDFLVEATVDKPKERSPQPGENGFPPGFAILTVLFNGKADQRIEWILTSDGLLQAWATINDRLERLDNNRLGTREKSPKLGIARRGDQILFLINRQVGLQRTIASLPKNFKVMLYGFGSTENDWDDVAVETTK